MLTRVAVYKPVYSYLDTSASRTIFEIVEPVAVDLGHPYVHTPSVAHRIQLSSPAEPCASLPDAFSASGLEGVPLITSSQPDLR
jgi:hypothetical protein